MLIHTLFLLAACSGGDSTTTGGPAVGGPASNPDYPDMVCPEGTKLTTGSSAKGEARWCDREGVMHGPFQRFYPDGQKAVQGTYDTNQEDGPWIWWHPNGKDATKGKYAKGREVGSWTWWHDNGSRAEEGDFLMGRKAGTWVAWYDTGRKKEEGLYQNGTKNGTWTYYNDDEENTVLKTERWENGEMKEEKVVNDPNKPPPKGKK